MVTFWIWITVVMAVIIGASVLVGKALSKPREEPMSRHKQMTGLKASGALKHRKSNRN